MSKNEAVLPERVREMRKALGLTQEGLAKAAGLNRIEIMKVERGTNKASSHRMRCALASGFGLSREDSDDLLEGRITVRTALGRRMKATGS
jgi:transcriptional regulator with XRE-family HTH domain